MTGSPRFNVVQGEDDPVVRGLEGLIGEVKALTEAQKAARPSGDVVVVPRWVFVSVFGVIMSAMITIVSVVFVTNKALDSLETLHGAEQRGNDQRFMRNESEIRDIRNRIEGRTP